MKLTIYKTTTILLTLAIFILFCLYLFTLRAEVVKAEDNGSSVSSETSVSAGVTTNPSSSPSPKPPLGKIRAQIENRIDMNKEIRNTALEQKKDVRMEMHQDIKGVRQDTRMQIKDMREERHDGMMMLKASSTDMFKKGAEMRKEMVKKMEARVFEIRKNALIHELSIAINNLTNISTRISTRITKAEEEGHVLTDAKSLLVIANDKLATAKIQLAAFQALQVSSSTATVSGTTTAQVDLTKPRVQGDAAIKAVKDAREAFKKVIQSISHSMGVGSNGSTTKERNGEEHDNNESTTTSH